MIYNTTTTTTTFASSFTLSFFTRMWCRVCSSIGLMISLASMLVLFILPSAAPPMPAERKTVERTSRRCSVSSVESTTSTLVGDAPEPALKEKEIRKARRGSFSESVLQNKIVLHRPKALVHLSSTMQTSVVIPASKLPSQIITPTKASVRCTLIKVARFSCKGYKASKKLVRKL